MGWCEVHRSEGEESGVTTDLFGHTQNDKLPGGAMCQRFIEPPFTVLDTKTGRWQDRKRDWLALGIESEIGRDVSGRAYTGGTLSPELSAAVDGRVGVMIGGKQKGYDPRVNKHLSEKDQKAMGVMFTNATTERNSGGSITCTSVFDPVLSELVYSWFMPEKQSLGILDPFAGGSVRGIVAARLGYKYNGIELRREQVEANIKQALAIPCDPKPHWICGDAAKVESLVGDEYDLLFTCPPYWNLERYSDLPQDLSTLDNWSDFCAKYQAIMRASALRLKSQRFAVVVVGNIRDDEGFLRDMRIPTANAMREAGFRHYNDFVLLTPIGSLPLRVNAQFSDGRKAGSAHQYVMCFFKGNPESIKREFTEFKV